MAPTHRSSASWRVRWATSTANVFVMTKPATNRASAANPRAVIVSTSTPSSRNASVACASSSAVRTSRPGSSAASPARSALASAPSAATTSSFSGPPSAPCTASHAASVAEVTRPEPLAPRVDASPPGSTPTTSSGTSCSTGKPESSTSDAYSWTATSSPTDVRSRSATAWLRAISPSAAGSRPSTGSGVRRPGRSGRSLITGKSVRAPFTSDAYVVVVAATSRTPSTAAARTTDPASRGTHSAAWGSGTTTRSAPARSVVTLA